MQEEPFEAMSDLIDWDEVRRRILEDDNAVAADEQLPAPGDLSIGLLFDGGTEPGGRAAPVEQVASPPDRLVIASDVAAAPSSRRAAAIDERITITEKQTAILRERAQALARVPEVEADPGQQLVAFSLGGETYCIPTSRVREVQPLQQVCPVPCTPAFVVGVISIRGMIYSVIDVRDLLGTLAPRTSNSAKVIMVSAAGLEIGILAEDVLGAVNVPTGEVRPPLAAPSSIREEYVQGVTGDMMIILNLDALMSDERIIVYEEVS